MRQPFWEDTYRDSGASTFGEPSLEIVDLASRLPAGSRVLDMGCGEGRNALFLARSGFEVDAFDLSEHGIGKLTAAAAKLGVRVNAWVEDMRSFEFTRCYDLVVSHGVLHLLAREEWLRVIEAMQEGTRVTGVNVVAVFTDALPTPEDLLPHVRGLFREGELSEIYSAWHIESFESYVKEDEHPHGIRHRHSVNKIVARRPGRRDAEQCEHP